MGGRETALFFMNSLQSARSSGATGSAGDALPSAPAIHRVALL